MKKFILAALFAFVAITAPAQTPDTVKTLAPVVILTDTLDSYTIGGEKYYLIATVLDSIYTNFRLVADQVQAENPQTPIEWVLILIKLLTSGVLASLFAAGVRGYNALKQLLGSLPRGEWVVVLTSLLLGFGWLYLDTKLVDFQFIELFHRVSGVFFVAIVAWRAGLNRLFPKKPEPEPARP
jgi:hypothetical protein